jgi:hypothetical protein
MCRQNRTPWSVRRNSTVYHTTPATELAANFHSIYPTPPADFE